MGNKGSERPGNLSITSWQAQGRGPYLTIKPLPWAIAPGCAGEPRAALGTETPALRSLTSEYTWHLAFAQNLIYLCRTSAQNVFFFFFSQSHPLSWGCLRPAWVVMRAYLCFLCSIQLPPAVCSWDVVWRIHHRNHDPRGTDQVLVTGRGMIWDGGCDVAGG